jgi:hypothetical protein
VLFQSLFTESLCGDQLLAPPAFSSVLRAPCPLLRIPFQFLVYYSIGFPFFLRGRESVQGAMLVYPRRICGNTACHLFAHLLVWISQAGLEPASGDVGPLLFSQCNVVWRSFAQAGGSGCQSFDFSWWFFSAKCGSSISAKFLIYGAHAVCFCPLVAILDPPLLLLIFWMVSFLETKFLRVAFWIQCYPISTY